MKLTFKLTLTLLLAICAAAGLLLVERWLANPAEPGQAAGSQNTYLPLTMNRYATGPTLGGCPVFPGTNVWNTPVDKLPVDAAKTAAYVASLGAAKSSHADFGSGLWDGGPIGIPVVVVPQSQPAVGINYTAYGNESDPGPFPIPANAPVEGGADSDGDRHVLVLQQGTCKLYELYRAFPQAGGSWDADSGAVYDLRANSPLRPFGWTSADAAGLAILPGLARYDEVAAGEIRHAIRFTANDTQGAYTWPARHKAGSRSTAYPPMGQRFRLKASVDISGAPYQAQVVLKALKKYGMILADNGSSWYLSGAPDERWNNTQLHWIDSYIHGSDFEVVDGASLMIDVNSGEAKAP